MRGNIENSCRLGRYLCTYYIILLCTYVWGIVLGKVGSSCTVFTVPTTPDVCVSSPLVFSVSQMTHRRRPNLIFFNKVQTSHLPLAPAPTMAEENLTGSIAWDESNLGSSYKRVLQE